MGGSSKQTIGYKYFAGLMVVIGNPIEKFLGINADNRGWMAHKDNDNQDKSLMVINNPNLFGGSNQEGGWVGVVDIHHGKDTQEQNQYLAKNIDLNISAYPNLSYLVFRGYDSITQSENLNKGFEVVSMSGMLKDFMLAVKRTRIKNNSERQWYEVNSNGDIVCEIDATSSDGEIIQPEPLGECSFYYKYTEGCSLGQDLVERIWTKNFNNVVLANPDFPYPKGDFVPTPASFSNQPPSSCFSQSSTQKNGYYHFEHNYKGAGEIVLSFEFIVPNSDDVENIDQYIDFYCNSDYTVNRNYETNKYLYVVRSKVPRKITATWNVKSAYYPKGIPAGIPWTYQYGLIFAQIHQLPYADKGEIEFFDINPIHKIREIITDYTAMNKSEALINNANFMQAADIVWSERLGISWSITEKSCKEALDELLYHIEAGLRINRQTGLYEVILFRDDLIKFDELISFNESNIKSINFDIANLDESISSINVSYYDRELIKDSSFLLYENGLERTRGFSISENIDFPYFMNRRNSELVGNWKLKQLSSPTWKGSFKTGISEARKINKYDVIKLSWENKGLIDLPIRILNINLGDGINNTVTLDFIEVIPYSNIDYTSTNVDPPIDENMSPQFNSNIAIEMPYFEAIQRFTQTQVDLELSNSPEIGYLMASAARPQNNSLNAHLYTDKATGIYANMSKVGVVDYCPAVYLGGEVGYLDTVLKVVNLDVVSSNKASAFSGATKGTWISLNNEIMVYESFNSELMEITVKRGALDTVPQKHESGIIFFSDDFSGIDPTQYIQGEIVQYQVLTTTPSSIKGLELGDSKFTEFNSRAIRPYPPANIKINGEYYPDDIETDLTITWVDRNRLQQTGGNIISWYDGGITIESGTSTTLIISEINEVNIIIATHNNDVTGTSSYTLPMSTLDPSTRYLNIVAKTTKNGFDSYQEFNHKVQISLFFTAPYDIEVEFKND